MSDDLPTTEIRTLKTSTTELPTTEIAALKSSSEKFPSSDDHDLPVTSIARIFTQANLEMTHTQHGILEEEVANLAQSMGSPIDVNTPQPTIKDLTPQPINGDRTTSGGHVTSSQTMINIDKGESAVTVAIHSKPKQLCSFMPGKCNCSDRLTMQKTKFVLYVFPLFLVISCFYVLISTENISNYTFLLILTILISSFISSWICILCILAILQIIFIIRDALFWCIVDKWNLEHKKAFIQAFSGVDLMEELDEQEQQLHQLRMLYVEQQKLRQQQERNMMNHNLEIPSDDAGDTSDDYDSTDNESKDEYNHKHNNTATISAPPLKISNKTSNTQSIRYQNIVSSSNETNNTNTKNSIQKSDDKAIINDIIDDIENVTDDEQSITASGISQNEYHIQSDTMVVNATNNMNITPTDIEEKKDIDPRPAAAPPPRSYKHETRDSGSVQTMVKKESFKLVTPNNNNKLHINVDNNKNKTPTTNSASGSDASIYTPIPQTANADDDTNIDTNILIMEPHADAINTDSKLTQIKQIANDPYAEAEFDGNEMSFDEEENLNTPGQTPIQQFDNNEIQLQNIMAQYGDMLEEMDLDGSQFNIWGTAHEEKEAYMYINGSTTAKMCIHIYRCCPLYQMKFMFCIKVSCELCRVLCIFFSIFFFFLTVVFVTANPIHLYVMEEYTPPYITETFSNTAFSDEGWNDNDDFIIAQTDQSKDVLTDIINYDQTFVYSMNDKSYFAPDNVHKIQEIINSNNDMGNKSKIIRVMGKAMSVNYVYVNDKNILIDMRKYPYNPVIDNNINLCVSDGCVGTVTVNTSITVKELNTFLYENSYVLHGFTGTDDITIGGALGSCSFGPLYNGYSLGYYIISASLIDGNGIQREYNNTHEINGIKYLDAIRCNLGVLGVIHQVKLEIFPLELTDRIEHLYNDFTELKINNDTNIIGNEMFYDVYSDELLHIKWIKNNNEIPNVKSMDINYDFQEDIFNTLLIPISCVYRESFHMAIEHYMHNGRYYKINNKNMPLTYSIYKPMFYVSRYGYIVNKNECINAINDAKDLANELYDEMRMLPIGVTYIKHGNSLIGYDNINEVCHIEIQINTCSHSRYSFAEKYEKIIVNKYNGTGHWGYLWFNNDILYKNRDVFVDKFEIIRNDIDPNGVFINKLYGNIFKNESNDVISTLTTEIYPRNCMINLWSFYFIAVWFGIMFILYLIGSYLRILPFLDSRSLDFSFKCCNDLNELDDLIEQDQQLLEKYGYDNNFDKVVEDLIDVEVLDQKINDYITITVTFETAFLILMGDTNYREWKYRETFAVSRNEELFERFERLGEELAWKSIYPRQCLFFSSCTLSVAMIIIAIIQASLS